MSLQVNINHKVVTFKRQELDAWCAGQRAECQDPYCQKLQGAKGFGEYIVGRHFEQQGYLWIHHDYDLFGTNNDGKYLPADEVLFRCLGAQRFAAARSLHPLLRKIAPIETPDLLIYKPDCSELRFAECKREDTRDKLREPQLRALWLIQSILRCEIDVFVVQPEGANRT